MRVKKYSENWPVVHRKAQPELPSAELMPVVPIQVLQCKNPGELVYVLTGHGMQCVAPVVITAFGLP